MATTWNPSDKSAAISLSNGNLTGTDKANNAWSSVRATMGISTGKKYFEFTRDGASGFAAIGVMLSAASLSSYVGNINGWGYFPDGNIYGNGSNLASSKPTFSGTTRVGIAIDADNRVITFYCNNVEVYSISSIPAGELFPAMSVQGLSYGTAYFDEAAILHTLPPGYSAWDSSAEPVVDKSWLMTLFNGAIKGIKGIAKSAIPFYDGEKWGVKEAGTPGQVLWIDDNGDLDWKTLIAGADLIEVADQASLPGVGAVKTIYLALDTNKLYYWKTNAYRELAPSTGGAGNNNITVSYTTPEDPEINHVWIDLNEGGIILIPEQVIPNVALVPPIPSMGVTTLLTPPPTTWNPNKVGTNVLLSDENFVAQMAGANRNVLATVGKSSGKWYFEAKTVGTAAEQTYVGVGTENTNLNGYLGSNAESWAYAWEGSAAYRFHAGIVSYGSMISLGDVLGVALDLDAGKLEFFRNGVSQGVAYASGVVGVLFPAVGGLRETNKIRGCFASSSFTYSPPAGYSAWDS